MSCQIDSREVAPYFSSFYSAEGGVICEMRSDVVAHDGWVSHIEASEVCAR